MNAVVNLLIKDHEHISRLLNCLDIEVERYQDLTGEPPHLDRILEALEYMQQYPEHYHHPLEDKVMDQIRPKVKDQALLKAMDVIHRQHRDLEQLTKKLKLDFEAIVNDQIVPMDELMKDFSEYAELQREHLEAENSYLIPKLSQYLTEEDVQAIVGDLSGMADPLFNEVDRQHYDALYDYILDYEEEQQVV